MRQLRKGLSPDQFDRSYVGVSPLVSLESLKAEMRNRWPIAGRGEAYLRRPASKVTSSPKLSPPWNERTR